jgi:hypothetical protein
MTMAVILGRLNQLLNLGLGQVLPSFRKPAEKACMSPQQALCAAIELAEKDGNPGHEPEVLV